MPSVSTGEPETEDRYGHPPRRQHCGTPRVVRNHRHAARSEAAACVMAHPWPWHAHGLTRLRRHRWPGAVDPEAGQADGREQDQGRDVHALSRPLASVAVPSSCLRAAHHAPALLHTRPPPRKMQLAGAAGACRRQTQAHALGAWPTGIATALSQGRTRSALLEPLVTARGSEAAPPARFPTLRKHLLRATPVKWRGVVGARSMARSGSTRLNALLASSIARQQSSDTSLNNDHSYST